MNMTDISLMGALSAVLTLLRFPIPFMPSFLSFDLAGVIEMIGELQNLILSCSYVMPALLIYRIKTKKRAVIGMAAGSLTVSVVAIFSNLYMIIPFYVTLFGMTMEDIIAMCHAVNPAMKDAFSMAMLGILPFNLIKYGCSSLLTFILYKHLSRPIKSFVTK